MSREATNSKRSGGVKRALLEAVFVAMIGVVVALAANGLSPRGLKLSRNYFPAGTNFTETAETATNAPTPVAAVTNVLQFAPTVTDIPTPVLAASNVPTRELAVSNVPGPVPETASVPVPEPIETNITAPAPVETNVSLATLAEVEPATEASTTNATTLSALPPTLIEVPRLAEKKLQAIDREQTVRFYRDPRRTNSLVVFVDARSDWNYKQGHIPGAYPFDPYRPDDYLSKVVPICQAAEQVVVYCTESDCDDSQLGAILLRDAGVTNGKLFVYVGGITDWTNANLPFEIGERNSGSVTNANQ